jgi:predicted transcriptional regulator
MTVTIHLPPELEKTIQQYAARIGQDLSKFVLQAVEEKVATAHSIREICAPFAQAVAATGIGDEEFDRFFDEAREEAWQEMRGTTPESHRR